MGKRGHLVEHLGGDESQLDVGDALVEAMLRPPVALAGRVARGQVGKATRWQEAKSNPMNCKSNLGNKTEIFGTWMVQ